MKNKKKILILIICAFAICFCFLLLSNDKSEYKTYKVFYDLVEKNQIEEVIFSDERIDFKIRDDKNCYYTDNSNSLTLKEKLLLNEVKIDNNKGFVESFYDAFDIFFIILFITALVIGLRRLSGESLFKVIKGEKTRFKDIVGMNNLKVEVMEIVDIMKNKEKYEKLGIKQPKGIILEGEPGNGKTLFARALAGEANMNFIATKGADFESAIMAVGPSKVRSLFRIARRYAPVIIFIAEFDGIGTKRNYSGSAIEIENTRIVTALLNELDGFKKNEGILVIAATNNSKVLDPALVRAGRFDRKYLITYPNYEERIDLIKFFTSKMELDEKVDIEKLSTSLTNLSASNIETIINEANIIANRKKSKITNEILKQAIELTKQK